MKINFSDLNDYFRYHKKDRKVTVAKVAESLDISGSYLYLLIQKNRYASNPLACKIEELLNIPKEALLRPPVHKSFNWRKNIFRRRK